MGPFSRLDFPFLDLRLPLELLPSLALSASYWVSSHLLAALSLLLTDSLLCSLTCRCLSARLLGVGGGHRCFLIILPSFVLHLVSSAPYAILPRIEILAHSSPVFLSRPYHHHSSPEPELGRGLVPCLPSHLLTLPARFPFHQSIALGFLTPLPSGTVGSTCSLSSLMPPLLASEVCS